jgi:nucleotide-binding universal stress UspA family protein
MGTVVAGHPVMVAVDGSEQSREALAWAVREAVQQHRALRVVHVWEAPLSGYVPVPDSIEFARTTGEETLHAALDRVSEWAPDLEVDGRLLRGFPSRVLIEEAAGTALLVLGSHGRGAVRRVMLGSVSTQVAEHAPVPVVVVHGQHTPGGPSESAAWRPGPVLVGVDGSPASEAAVAFAFEAASRRGGELVAVHAWASAVTLGYGAEGLIVDAEELQESGQQALATSLAGYRQQFPDVKVTTLVLEGRAVDGIIEVAEDRKPSLVVVGSRGRGGFSGLLLGSTSRQVLHHASCPVAVVRT